MNNDINEKGDFKVSQIDVAVLPEMKPVFN